MFQDDPRSGEFRKCLLKLDEPAVVGGRDLLDRKREFIFQGKHAGPLFHVTEESGAAGFSEFEPVRPGGDRNEIAGQLDPVFEHDFCGAVAPERGFPARFGCFDQARKGGEFGQFKLQMPF